MESKVATYQIELLEEEFQYEDSTCKQTIVASTYVENKLVSKHKYGYVTKENVYEALKQNQSVNLNHCYVKDFSISEYKKSINCEELKSIELIDFIAENAFFDCTLRTDFSYINFNGIVNFNDTVFSHGNLSFYESSFLGPSTTFKNAEFGNGEISFQYVNFGDNPVDFGSSKFYGGVVSFVSAHFNNGSALFNNVNFYDSKIKFHYTTFGSGDLSFHKAKFGNETLDFRKVEFGTGRVDFRRAVFGDCYIVFDESEFKSGKVNFRSARFGKNDMSFKHVNFGEAEILFENVDFGTGSVSFSQSTSKYISFKGAKLDVALDLCVKKADKIDLSETIVRDIIDLKTINHRVNINTLYINGMRNLGRIIIDWEDNNVLQLISSQQKTTLHQKAEQFNILKEDFHLSGKYEDEDKAYIQFKRYELMGDYDRSMRKGGKEYFKLPNYVFRWLVFDKMGLYATSPIRVFLSMGVIYIIFSLMYLLQPIFGNGHIINSVGATDGMSYFQTCFYHSAITFLTIGYGDFYPTGFSRGISIIEGWMGLFLMSYFTVAFVRKILR